MRRLGLIVGTFAVLIVVLFSVWVISRPERGTTGSVNTKFRLLGPNDKIIVDGFDDPKVDGVACHISRAQTGGMKGALGVAEDTSDASIACRQIGPIKIKGEIEDGERVFDGGASSSKRFRSSASSTGSATCWSMWLTATASSKAARRTASAAFRS